MRVTNILDPIHEELDPRVWDDPKSDKPTLKPKHLHWIKKTIYGALEQAGYTDVEKWLHLVLTGSLTTYQYSDESDCDVSLFVDVKALPEWSRAEMIGIMVGKVDGTPLPGTPHPMQDFVVGRGITPDDLYKPGLRSGYDLDAQKWIESPDRDRVHDVQAEENGFYSYALQMADKMERLLRYEPEKAIEFWHAIHKRRMRDMNAGKGDFAESNIVYKFLANRGLFPAISEASGEYIAKTAMAVPLYHVAPTSARQGIEQNGLIGHERGETQSPWTGELGQPSGNYFWDDPAAAEGYVYPLHNAIQKQRGEKVGEDFPGDDPDILSEHGVYNGTVLEPETEDGYEEEMNEVPYEHTNPEHRALLPPHLQGYDIWHVPEHGLQNVQRDPEDTLAELHHERGDGGWITPEEALERTRQMEEEHEDPTYEGSSPMRYYTPEHVPPDKLKLYKHIPPWEMTKDNFYNTIEDDRAQEYPAPYHHVPIDDWESYKPPEFGEWKAAVKTGARVLYNNFRPEEIHPPTGKEPSLPWIYDPSTETVHLGPPRSFHWELIQRTPELQGQYQKAWEGPPQAEAAGNIHGGMEWPSRRTDFMGKEIDPEVKHSINQALGAPEEEHEWTF